MLFRPSADSTAGPVDVIAKDGCTSGVAAAADAGVGGASVASFGVSKGSIVVVRAAGVASLDASAAGGVAAFVSGPSVGAGATDDVVVVVAAAAVGVGVTVFRSSWLVKNVWFEAVE